MYFIRLNFYKFFGKESWNVFIIVEVAPPSNGFISTVKRTLILNLQESHDGLSKQEHLLYPK